MIDYEQLLQNEHLSPMMRQYLNTKKANLDSVLFYRLGDFYELFFDDAVEISHVLDLTLTGKDCGIGERAPMCGVPYHSVDTYINKLISLGYKIAICEQTSDPKDKKKSSDVVQRDIVRIITPGTLIDEGLLNDKQNNYIASIYVNQENIGFAYLDLSTGEFKSIEFSGESRIKDLNDNLVRIMPSEILAYCDKDIENSLQVRQLDLIPKFTYSYPELFEKQTCEEVLSKQFSKEYKEKFSLKRHPSAIIACGAIFGYIKSTQKRDLSHISTIKYIGEEKFMLLDINTRRNLEIMETLRDRRKKGSLLNVMDKTRTSMGARLIKSWIEQPLYDAKQINLRLDAVEDLCSKIILRDNLTTILNKCNDIERISGRISYNNFTPKDCKSLCESLSLLPSIKALIEPCNAQFIKDVYKDIDDYSDIVTTLRSAIVDNPPALTNVGGIFNSGYSKELDEYKFARDNSQKLISEYEAKQRNITGIKNLKVAYNKVYGYYIEINKQFISNLPLEYIRKQTVANNERYISEELKDLEEKLSTAEEKSIKLEQKLFNDIREGLLTKVVSLQKSSNAIARLDCILSFAQLAIKNNYTKPKINNKLTTINIIDGRHPVVEELSKDEFIPNDTHLDENESRTMIITGPNMAGKSTYMRQVALITLMAHMGSFVPAKQAEIALTDRIFTRVGASDDLALGQSTFMVEMSEVANILQNATDKSLIVLDEIGRGTSTYDGLSIAWAVVEYLSNNMHAKTLFSTHYHELTELENFLPGVKNYKITVKEINGHIVFLRKIARGGASRSFGIEVAALAGVPEQIIQRAKEISNMLEQNDTTKTLALNTTIDKDDAKEKDIRYTEVIGILKDIDINRLTPISAFEIIADLKNKIK